MIRKAIRSDAAEIVDLIVRLKKLNNEFDPLFGVVGDAKERAEKYVEASFQSPETLMLVAATHDRVIGAIRAEIRERMFYTPRTEGYITEMYVLPEHRRGRLGQELLEKAMADLKSMGAEIIVADLPSRNEIAVHFYTKRGFRRLVETFAHTVQ
jgi:ribosomal protein S18 acetylase RimI-like enzyme